MGCAAPFLARFEVGQKDLRKSIQKSFEAKQRRHQVNSAKLCKSPLLLLPADELTSRRSGFSFQNSSWRSS